MENPYAQNSDLQIIPYLRDRAPLGFRVINGGTKYNAYFCGENPDTAFFTVYTFNERENIPQKLDVSAEHAAFMMSVIERESTVEQKQQLAAGIARLRREAERLGADKIPVWPYPKETESAPAAPDAGEP
jgi:hypothetical protein